MKKSSTYYALLLVLGILISSMMPLAAFSQITDTTGTQSGLRGAPRVYKYGTRTTALGDATVADAHDLSDMNINPSAIAFVTDFNAIQFDAMQNWNNNFMFENLTVPVIRIQQHTLAAQFSIYNGGFEGTNFLGTSPMPQPDLAMYQFDLAYAISIENVLSFGVYNNITFARNDHAQFWTYFPVFGLMYAPSKSISYGIAFRGLGRSVTYLFPDASGITALNSQNLRESLELGATLKFPVNTDKTYLSLSLSNEKRFGERGIWYKAGLELTTIPHLALRGGMLLLPEDDLYAPRFGVGFITKRLELNYSISYQKRMYERYHQLGITVHLN